MNVNEFIDNLKKAVQTIDQNRWGPLQASLILAITFYSVSSLLGPILGFPNQIGGFSWEQLAILSSLIIAAYSVLVIQAIRSQKSSNKVDNITFFVKSFPHSQSGSFFTEIETLMSTSKKITLVGAGINLLWQNNLIDIIIRRAQLSDVEVTICMANPFGPHMENRYIEEEMTPLESFAEGRLGMRNKVRKIVNKIRDAGNPKAIKYCLFEHYPTLTTLIFDKNIFVYPYAYRALGNTSPVFHFIDDKSETSNFLIDNADRIVEAAIPAADVVFVDEKKSYFSQDWIGAAVFIIPKRGSQLYEFGSNVLGYDIWDNKLLEHVPPGTPGVRDFIGEANVYGFHATIADALFFAAESGIERVEAELKFLSEEFAPFIINGLRFDENFRESNDIVLIGVDESGTVEALHHELVQRMYKLAISSTFRARKTEKKISPTKSNRGQLMIDRYGAPNILKEHRLHFTLCSLTPVDSNERIRIKEQLLHAAKSWQALEPIEIDEICLVTKERQDEHWKVRKTFALSRRI